MSNFKCQFKPRWIRNPHTFWLWPKKIQFKKTKVAYFAPISFIEGAYWASIAQGGNRDLILSSRRLGFYSTDLVSGLWEAPTLILFNNGGGKSNGRCRNMLTFVDLVVSLRGTHRFYLTTVGEGLMGNAVQIVVFIFVNRWIHQIISWFYLTTVWTKGKWAIQLDFDKFVNIRIHQIFTLALELTPEGSTNGQCRWILIFVNLLEFAK